MHKVIAIVVVAAGLTAACAPKYQPPVSTMAPAPALIDTDTTAGALEARWWTQFDDAVLDGLIARALAANRDLRAAALRYQAALEYAGAAKWLQLPGGGVTAGASTRQLAQSEAAPGMDNRRMSLVHVGAGVAWEADLFGRLRGMRRVAAADAQAAAMDARGVQVAIVSQVAAAYFDYRGAERDAVLIGRLTERTLQHLETTRTLIAAGRSTRLDLLRAQQIEEELTVASAAAAHRGERARNRIATLVGEPAGSIGIAPAVETPLRSASLRVGTAAELLRRRPDIAAAEARVAAAAARAAVARAEMFPRVEVAGTIGLVAGSFGSLTEVSAGSWLVAPRLIWNVLDWPRLRRELRAAGAFADAAFAEYEQTVLRALEETQTALDAHAAANRELAAQQRRAQASADAAGVVFVQHREGLVDSLARTLADRDAIAGALDANRALTAQRLAVVDVYRALGGGWQ
jgi:NodT family efflux transporter outer membrane factor (OMF) lipoprotein